MKRFAVLALILLCLSLNVAARPGHSFWISRYKQIEKLFNDRDIQAVEQMVSEKFVIIDERGRRHSRSDFVKDELQSVAQANFSENTVKIRWIRQSGATVDVAYDWRYSLAYDDPQNGRYKVHGHEVGTDTWKRFGKDWLLVRTKIDTSSQTKHMGT